MNEMIVKQEDARPDNGAFLAYAEDVVKKTYLPTLSERSAVQCCGQKEIKALESNAKLFQIGRIIYNRKENNLQKLTTLYTSFYETGADIAMILHSDGEQVKLYMGVCNTPYANRDAQALFETFKGNFPGSIGSEQDQYNDLCLTDEDMSLDLDRWITADSSNAICSVSVVPTTREKDLADNEKFVQGIERVLDAMHGKIFTAVILAQNINAKTLDAIKVEYERLYSNLSPYAKTSVTFGENRTESVNDSVTHSVNESITEGTSVTLSVGHTTTATHTDSSSRSKTNSTSVFGGVGSSKGISIGRLNIGRSHNFGGSLGHSVSNTIGQSDSIAHSTQENEANGTQHNTTKGEGDATQHGTSKGIGSSLSYQIELQQKTVADLMSCIDQQLERIRSSECFGMFGVAAYFIAPNQATAQTAASMYKALLSGHGSHIENSHINTWTRKSPDFNVVQSSLRCLQHPSFLLGNNVTTPATLVSGKELALEMGLPMRSVPGITVMETVPFGRNIQLLDTASSKNARMIPLGKIYHMWEAEKTPVTLDPQALTAHVFVTGSTGAGKSNTIYHMLDELTRDGSVKFMVIEPAKGEYKDVFGGRSDVQVYSTNPRKAKLLRINPFAFPVDEISVQEHLDRLVEIFNVCWPMYAAMPAILKDACERAYAAAGWDIAASINWKQENCFPCFADVLEQIKKVLEESAYSADNKSDYTGALVTRIRSLTTGIYGQVFTNDSEAALFGEKLFDENVIVDLSRVGSTETKSLIMGLLVMQMQEYRMASAKEANSALKHITVLEEAHNILKRTSTEQSAESANLAGKSVEMLSNAIAEMRTYGEGFIIADQAPGLLDMAAIRNTNTKIIMRLPDEEDRKLVGKAAGLNDDQIVELSKLPTGVAAVYQNDWIEPILCKIPRFENAQPLKYTPEARGRLSTTLSKYFTAISRQEKPDNLSGEEIDTIRRWSRTVSSSEDTIRLVERGLQGSLDKENVGVLCYNLLDGGMLCESVVCTDAVHLQDVIPTYLVKRFGFDETLAGVLCNLILMAAAHNYPEQRLEIEQKVELLKFGGEVQ